MSNPPPMTEQKMLNPPLMWAQDRSKVYLTVRLQDIKKEKIDFMPTAVHFRGTSENKEYSLQLELFGEIDTSNNETRYSKYGRYTQINMKKKDQKWWLRLAKTDAKLVNLKIDWEKWVDDPDDIEAPKASKFESPEEMNPSTSSDDEEPSEPKDEKETKESSTPKVAEEAPKAAETEKTSAAPAEAPKEQ